MSAYDGIRGNESKTVFLDTKNDQQSSLYRLSSLELDNFLRRKLVFRVRKMKNLPETVERE